MGVVALRCAGFNNVDLQAAARRDITVVRVPSWQDGGGHRHGPDGRITARLLWHLRCRVLAFDPFPDDGLRDLGVEYVELGDLWPASDIITLNCPLSPDTHHLVDDAAIAAMRPGVMLVNTGRGALIDTVVLRGPQPAHQGFFTHKALAAIAETTIGDLDDLDAGRPAPNAVPA